MWTNFLSIFTPIKSPPSSPPSPLLTDYEAFFNKKISLVTTEMMKEKDCVAECCRYIESRLAQQLNTADYLDLENLAFISKVFAKAVNDMEFFHEHKKEGLIAVFKKSYGELIEKHCFPALAKVFQALVQDEEEDALKERLHRWSEQFFSLLDFLSELAGTLNDKNFLEKKFSRLAATFGAICREEARLREENLCKKMEKNWISASDNNTIEERVYEEILLANKVMANVIEAIYRKRALGKKIMH